MDLELLAVGSTYLQERNVGDIDQTKLRRTWMAIGLAGAAVLIGLLFLQWRANSIVGPWADANGKRLPDGTSRVGNGFPLVIHTFNGDSHCDWESAVFLHMVVAARDGVWRPER